MNTLRKEDTMRSIAQPLNYQEIPQPASGRMIIMGDVHGCYDEMMDLLTKINYQEASDTLISVGDLMMKGPKTREVMKFFMANPRALVVKGNHEYAVERWYHQIHLAPPGWPIPYGLREGSEHQEYARSMSEEEYQYISKMPHILVVGEPNPIIIVHAGINPYIPLRRQNSFDLMHVRNIDRGFCTEKISSGEPWVNLLSIARSATYVFGHDAMRGFQIGRNYYGLDTACLYGKELTALVINLDQGGTELVSVPARAAYQAENPGALL